MKRLFFLLFIINTISINAQQLDEAINMITKDAYLDQKILIGAVNEKSLEIIRVWPNARFNYNDYKTDKSIIAQIKQLSDNYTVKVFFGSWCSDSEYWVPAFFKIVDEIGIDKSRIQYYAVNSDKEIPLYNIQKYDIQYVPTFIFYKNEEEIGRIVETPESGILEKDVLKIIGE